MGILRKIISLFSFLKKSPPIYMYVKESQDITPEWRETMKKHGYNRFPSHDRISIAIWHHKEYESIMVIPDKFL